MTHSTRDRLLLALGAFCLAAVVARTPTARSGDQNLGTFYTSPSCPDCVSLRNSLSRSGWTPGTSPGTLVNGASTITVINTSAPGAVVPSNINSIPAFTPAAGEPTLVGSSTINQHLTAAAQAHAITEQNVPPDQTPTEKALTDTFQQSPTFQSAVDRLIEAAARGLAGFLQAAGLAPGAGSVSKYKNPDPGYLGYGPADRYSPPDPLHLTQLERALGHERQGRRETSVTGADPARLHQRGFSDAPNPRPLDTPGQGARCGTKPGDRYWVGFPRVAPSTASEKAREIQQSLETSEFTQDASVIQNRARSNLTAQAAQGIYPLDCFCRCGEQIYCPVGGPLRHVIYGGPLFEAVSCQVCFGPGNIGIDRIKKHDYFVGLHHHGQDEPLGYPIQFPSASGYQECLRQSITSPAEEAKVEGGGGQPRRPFFGL